MLTLFRTKFLIRVNYTSGLSQDFWVSEFSYKFNSSGRTLEWKHVNGTKPLFINVEAIESLWTIKTRRNILNWVFGMEW